MAEPLDDKTAFGIDLGTTLSVVAQVNSAGLPVVLPNAEGSPTTPSIVLFDAGHAVAGAVDWAGLGVVEYEDDRSFRHAKP